MAYDWDKAQNSYTPPKPGGGALHPHRKGMFWATLEMDGTRRASGKADQVNVRTFVTLQKTVDGTDDALPNVRKYINIRTVGLTSPKYKTRPEAPLLLDFVDLCLSAGIDEGEVFDAFREHGIDPEPKSPEAIQALEVGLNALIKQFELDGKRVAVSVTGLEKEASNGIYGMNVRYIKQDDLVTAIEAGTAAKAWTSEEEGKIAASRNAGGQAEAPAPSPSMGSGAGSSSGMGMGPPPVYSAADATEI